MRNKRLIIIAILVLVFGLGLKISGIIFAATVSLPPAAINSATGTVRNPDIGATDISNGVSLSSGTSSTISVTPATPNHIFAQLSGINTPVWVSPNGPLQIVSDLKVYGMVDFRNGIVSNAP